jgi:hypothetical protein
MFFTRLQLFGFSGSPSSNRMIFRLGAFPSCALDASDREFVLACELSVDGVRDATFSIASSFSVSDGLSTSFSISRNRAARELSTPATLTR